MSSITVLLPVYNGAPYLAVAVRSILEQSFKDFTLLVIDDASTDDTLTVMKGFNDARIVLVRNEKNLGLIATLNKGIDLCKTE
jgi:glycosyltransferase involved in cell wall biosynthesis